MGASEGRRVVEEHPRQREKHSPERAQPCSVGSGTDC